MNRIVSINNTEGKDVFLVIEHIKAIYKLSNCYSVIYGDSEESFVQVDKENFMYIMQFFTT